MMLGFYKFTLITIFKKKIVTKPLEIQKNTILYYKSENC